MLEIDFHALGSGCRSLTFGVYHASFCNLLRQSDPGKNEFDSYSPNRREKLSGILHFSPTTTMQRTARILTNAGI